MLRTWKGLPRSNHNTGTGQPAIALPLNAKPRPRNSKLTFFYRLKVTHPGLIGGLLLPN